MSDPEQTSGSVKLQKFLVWLIVAVFAISVIAHIFSPELGVIFYNISLVVLILSAPIRFIWMSEYFRNRSDHKYQIFAYLVIIIIAFSAALRALH